MRRSRHSHGIGRQAARSGFERQVLQLVLCASLTLGAAGCGEPGIAPKGYFESNIEKEAAVPYGGFAHAVLKSDGRWFDPKPRISGELIAVHADTIFVLDHRNLHAVARDAIESVLVLHHSQPYSTGMHAAANIIASPVLIGFWCIPAFPIHLLTGGTLSGDPGDWQTLKYPKKFRWTELAKGARFPAGIPPTLDRSRIQQKTSYESRKTDAFGVWE